jgi:hypothetical protein
MGQYHITVNLDKREFLFPHDLGDGLKLWEQAASSFGTWAALGMLLAVSNGRGGGDFESGPEFYGRWAGDRIVIIGDYGEAMDLLGIDRNGDDFCGACLYDRCSQAHVYPDGEREAPAIEPCESCGHPVTGNGWLNVSPIVAGALQREGGFTLTGDGWRHRTEA